MRLLPPLNSVRALEAAVRHNNFTSAAAELGVTQGAISRQIKVIELFLGVKLFSSSGRGMKPTERASIYARELRLALDRIGFATEEIIEPGSATLVRVSSPPAFASHWLVPRLPMFYKQNPNIDVRVNVSSLPVCQLSDPFEVAFQRANAPLPGYETKIILNDYCLPVCAPSLIARQPVRCGADLREHTLLCQIKFASMWTQWLRLAEVPDDVQPRRLHLANLQIALQAAYDGLGFVLAPIRLISIDMAKGRLVAPFHEPFINCQPIEMLYPTYRSSIRTKSFISWILEQAELDREEEMLQLAPPQTDVPPNLDIAKDHGIRLG